MLKLEISHRNLRDWGGCAEERAKFVSEFPEGLSTNWTQRRMMQLFRSSPICRERLASWAYMTKGRIPLFPFLGKWAHRGKFPGLKLTGILVRGPIEYAEFERAAFHRVAVSGTFRCCTFKGSSFYKSTFSCTFFRNCTFEDCSFSFWSTDSMAFEDCRFTRCRFDEVWGRTILSDCTLINCGGSPEKSELAILNSRLINSACLKKFSTR